MSYALITGASSGIGRCYAIEMAKRGYNIVAVSNQPQQLDEVARQITSDYSVEVVTIAIAF